MLDFFKKLFRKNKPSQLSDDEMSDDEMDKLEEEFYEYLKNEKEDDKIPLSEHKAILEKYKDLIDSTIKPYIEIIASEDSELAPWQSKFGGAPYLPKNVDYPKNSAGEYLYLLAQINFEEMPKLDPYPEKGVLQFWICGHAHYGEIYKDPTKQDSFRIIYYPEIKKDNLVNDFSFLPQQESDGYLPLPAEAEYSLKFQMKQMPVDFCDFRYDQMFDDIEEAEKGFYNAYVTLCAQASHRIGGYPSLVQADPREGNHESMTHLLLQIAFNPHHGEGVTTFFISEDDLKKRNFSKVLFDWACD